MYQTAYMYWIFFSSVCILDLDWRELNYQQYHSSKNNFTNKTQTISMKCHINNKTSESILKKQECWIKVINSIYLLSCVPIPSIIWDLKYFSFAIFLTLEVHRPCDENLSYYILLSFAIHCSLYILTHFNFVFVLND
jgi:hypothetical protein